MSHHLMPPSFWLRRGSASQGDATRAERGKPRPTAMPWAAPEAALPLHPYQPMSTGTPNALTGLAARQTFAELCTCGDAGEASPYAQVAKACFSTTHIPATRPPVGPRLRDSFLFVNGFSLVCRRRTTRRRNFKASTDCAWRCD